MNDRIQEIKQRQAEATPGPWTHSRWAPGYVVTDDDKFDVVASVVEYRENGTIESKFCGDKSLANREFIAHAPDDVSYLLSEVERLQTENERLMKEAAFWNQAADNQRDNNYLLLKDRAIMKGALEWYGNEENYEEGQLLQDPECGDYYNDPPKVIVDQGRCARTALSHLKG